jgi:hypothetical protein
MDIDRQNIVAGVPLFDQVPTVIDEIGGHTISPRKSELKKGGIEA